MALVVGVVMLPGPAREHQRRFHLGQARLGHQQVDVGEQPALRRRQPGARVGSAFQQHQRQAEAPQRFLHPRDLEARRLRVAARQRIGPFQVFARLRRHALEQAVFGQRQRGGGARRAQDQRRLHRDLRGRRVNTASASSRSL